MQEHAFGVVKHFSYRHEIALFTAPGNGVVLPNVTIIDQLIGCISKDVALLRRHRADAWLALSAGSASCAPFLLAPFFAYVHGNDFIKPWAPLVPPWLHRLESISWRLASYAETVWRRGKIGAGLRRADFIFANSRYTRDRACSMFSLDPESITVIAPGIDDSHFEISVPEVRKNGFNPLKILTVSRLNSHDRRKNIDAVIHAIARLEKTINIQCIIVGDGNDKTRLQRLAADLGVAPRVHFAGGVSRQTREQFYGWADVFVLPVKPSSSDVEGFGMVYIEANAHGLPVIAVDCGGVADAVSPKTGILLKCSSASAVAEAISSFHSRTETFQPETIRGIAGTFSAKATCEKLIERVEIVCSKISSRLLSEL